MPKIINYSVGQRLHNKSMLSFVRDHGIHTSLSGQKKRTAVFLCDCGNTKAATINTVKTGKSLSCGCLKSITSKKMFTTHGMSKTSEYEIWAGVKRRCYKRNCKAYKNYGERGIKMSDQWRDSFESFFKDMGVRPKNSELDRVDNNGNYSKENCRWATRRKNTTNTRRSKWWFINGTKYESAPHASIALGVPKQTIRNWCNGYYSRDIWHEPKHGCYCKSKYSN